jgi:hypothetical protein
VVATARQRWKAHGNTTHLDLVRAADDARARVLVLHHAERDALPVALHPGQRLFKPGLLAGGRADDLQPGQRLQQVVLQQVPHAERRKACAVVGEQQGSTHKARVVALTRRPV